jgi:hypothetical protein
MLRIRSRAFTGETSLAEIATLQNLLELDLSNSGVTDDHVREIASLGSLERLNLGFTQIGDAALSSLSAPGSLRALEIINTQVTDDGIRAFSEQHPLCKVVPNRLDAPLQCQDIHPSDGQ